MWSLEKNMHSEAYGIGPLYHINRLYNDFILDPKRILNNYVFLQRTNYKNHDAWWNGGTRESHYHTGFFYKISETIHRPVVSEVDPNIFYSTKLLLDPET